MPAPPAQQQQHDISVNPSANANDGLGIFSDAGASTNTNGAIANVNNDLGADVELLMKGAHTFIASDFIL